MPFDWPLPRNFHRNTRLQCKNTGKTCTRSEPLSSRGWLMSCVLLGLLAVVWGRFGKSSTPRQFPPPTVIKESPVVVQRTFDPENPPAEMALAPGENAACASDFASHANVHGETETIDSTHATVTVTQIQVALKLTVTIWVPPDVSQHVMEHEQGHREISEYFYGFADKVAHRLLPGISVRKSTFRVRI